MKLSQCTLNTSTFHKNFAYAEEKWKMFQPIRGQGGYLIFPIGLKNTNFNGKGCHDIGKTYCDIFSLYCDIFLSLHFQQNPINFSIFMHLTFEPYVIESELYTCIHDCMKTFYKGITVTGIHPLELQLL